MWNLNTKSVIRLLVWISTAQHTVYFYNYCSLAYFGSALLNYQNVQVCFSSFQPVIPLFFTFHRGFIKVEIVWNKHNNTMNLNFCNVVNVTSKTNQLSPSAGILARKCSFSLHFWLILSVQSSLLYLWKTLNVQFQEDTKGCGCWGINPERDSGHLPLCCPLQKGSRGGLWEEKRMSQSVAVISRWRLLQTSSGAEEPTPPSLRRAKQKQWLQRGGSDGWEPWGSQLLWCFSWVENIFQLSCVVNTNMGDGGIQNETTFMWFGWTKS